MPDFQRRPATNDRSSAPRSSAPRSNGPAPQRSAAGQGMGDAALMGNAAMQEQMAQQQLSEDERARLTTIAEILRYEEQNGTWAMIKRYNVLTGDIPGRNVWAKMHDGGVADLCWVFDVAYLAQGSSQSVGEALGFLGEAGEKVAQLTGIMVGGLSYLAGRAAGATAEGAQGNGGAMVSYLKGTLNEDNANGMQVAIALSVGNAKGEGGGGGISLRTLIHPGEIEKMRRAGLL